MINFPVLHNELDNEQIETLVRLQVKVFLSDYFMFKGDLTDCIFLVDDLGADSLDLLQVIQTLNDIFQISVSVDHLPRMLTVGGVCDVIEELHSPSF